MVRKQRENNITESQKFFAIYGSSQGVTLGKEEGKNESYKIYQINIGK